MTCAGWTRAERRRAQVEATERLRSWREERDAFIRTQLAPDESVIGQSQRFGYVTGRRILLVDRFRLPPRAGAWHLTDIAFVDVGSWAVGRLHDHRPVLRLEHSPRPRIHLGPSVQILGLRWGEAETRVDEATTTLEFSRTSDAFFVEVRRGLERVGVPAGPGFVVGLPGTRAQRCRGGGVILLGRSPVRHAITRAVRRTVEREGSL